MTKQEEMLYVATFMAAMNHRPDAELASYEAKIAVREFYRFGKLMPWWRRLADYFRARRA